MNRFIIILGLMILVFLVSLSLAEIPKLINYQGMLSHVLDNPITDTLNLEFGIYTQETDGTPEWSETQTQVPIIDGLFNVILGSVDPNSVNLDFSEPYWLEVVVEDDTMPRIRFTSVGYAYRAWVADSAAVAGSVGGGGGGWVDDGTVVRLETGSDSVSIGTDDPAAKLHLVGGELQINTSEIGGYYSHIDGNEISGGVAGGGPGYHHLRIKPGDNSSYLLLAEDGGNVGIGITDPQRTLHVKDVLRLEPQASVPSGDLADLYVGTDGKLYFHNGSAWKEVQLGP